MALATELHVTREALHAERRHRAEAEQQRHRIELELKVTILTLLHFIVMSVCHSLNLIWVCVVSVPHGRGLDVKRPCVYSATLAKYSPPAPHPLSEPLRGACHVTVRALAVAT